MIGFVRLLVFDFLGSFHNNPGGWSGRKLSAFFAVVMAAYNLKFGNSEIAVEMTMVWLTFALLCLGIITVQQVLEFRSGTKVKTNEQETKTTQAQ